jgi:hypothetical protein
VGRRWLIGSLPKSSFVADAPERPAISKAAWATQQQLAGLSMYSAEPI